MIELLVVLVILGSLLGVVLLSGLDGGRHRALRAEAERLATLIELLTDQAVLNGREYGLRLEASSYQVLGYEEATGLWQPLAEEGIYTLPEWAHLELRLDGQPLQLGGTAVLQDQVQPQLMILSSGEFSPFQLHLRVLQGDGPVFRLTGDGFKLPQVEAVAEGQ